MHSRPWNFFENSRQLCEQFLCRHFLDLINSSDTIRLCSRFCHFQPLRTVMNLVDSTGDDQYCHPISLAVRHVESGIFTVILVHVVKIDFPKPDAKCNPFTFFEFNSREENLAITSSRNDATTMRSFFNLSHSDWQLSLHSSQAPTGRGGSPASETNEQFISY